MSRVWDISPALHPGMVVWPGDTPYEEARTWHLEGDCPVNVSRITLSTHTGAHADAPLHYSVHGKAIGEVDLHPYLGPARVIDVRGCGALVRPEHVMRAFDPGPTERLLIRTGERVCMDAWDAAFSAIGAETIRFVSRRGVVLIGVDTPSLDPADSKTLEAHAEVGRAGMAILEGLVLDQVPEGDYELIALPLKFARLDASPVRAILRR